MRTNVGIAVLALMSALTMPLDSARSDWSGALYGWTSRVLDGAGRLTAVPSFVENVRYELRGRLDSYDLDNGTTTAHTYDITLAGMAGKAGTNALKQGVAALASRGGKEIVEEAGSKVALGSVFWSGSRAAQRAAETWAAANGGTTLEMSAAGKALEAATKGLEWSAAKPMWSAASKAFASGASGEAHVFQSAAGVKLQSIWGDHPHAE